MHLFDRGIKAQVGRCLRPSGDSRGNAAVEVFEIGFHRAGLEGDRQSLAMQSMLVEVEQQQAAREQQSKDPSPAVGRGEEFVLIQQNEFIGLGAEQRDHAPAEGVTAIDRAVFPSEALYRAFGVSEQFQGVADERPAVRAGDVGERAERRLGDRGRSERLTVVSYRSHGVCSGRLHRGAVFGYARGYPTARAKVTNRWSASRWTPASLG